MSSAHLEREFPRHGEGYQDANATIFRNMALANPVAAKVRSVALRGLSHAGPIVRRMTEKEALVRQSLYVPDGKVPRDDDQDANSDTAPSRKPTEEDADELDDAEG